MAGTRRSTRQTTSAVPKYNESDSSEVEKKVVKRKGTQTTRRKRVREEKEHDEDNNDDDDDDEDEDEDSPPPKKAAKPKATSTVAKPKATSTVAKPSKAMPPPAPASESNRDANGNQEVFWLLKAEPLPRYENGVNVAFSIDDLAACTVPEPWGGVRNPQARNNMQAMRKGDLGFFYHSNAKPSGVVGILRVAEEAKVDETAFDKKDPYYDAKSDREKPKWYCVGVDFVKKFDDVIDLATIKSHAGSGGKLEGMQLVTNSRLSVCRVRKEEWHFILGLAGEKDATTDGKTEGAEEDEG
ncbi:hypothetical protein HBH56_184640 [Parastagonospora nodorum]|uniref:Thymocyte nuclear protein 1 n=2 Tax=Phaeosphaeria nodorum (strain SN15 / ATCC MYA-4574 / FGSC 10173) TaxID=321614 RepID=A0A7U2FF02_PHANO|nr:hypothetical protein SNOG_12791 [Parastagonospora nodorum SN15]KAH3908058.1 hypothetical protein HBH56_184640 [Parastagonospora nodorum]EAT79591.1 hypothetical protein SNOG_12791 [Parastagonospora nodorum SN15]KAH3925970.1 hypothetical protein HBH54_173790 [Parastagonospora nodorum]KAH3962407.1 hypothetical protein HBH52_225260 [Parastagonospora nodorum]KAH4117186.1 hypothetical protein HBH47_154380 [Parastagonospora nodorum]